MQLTKKFGTEPESEAPQLLRKAIELQLAIVGISFHVGGGCNDPTIFERAIHHARKLFDLSTTLGKRMYLLDIGGGYPGYCNENVSLYKVLEGMRNFSRLPLQIGSIVNAALEAHFGDYEELNVISEPGRYFAMPSACAVAQIFAKRSVSASDVVPGANLKLPEGGHRAIVPLDADLNNEDRGYMYYLSDGVFGSFNCTPVYRIRPPFIVLGKVTRL